jgi:predicted transcriptional regulator
MELAAVENGMALASADGLISHDAMKAWLQSWGTTEEVEAPDADLIR